MFRSKVFQYAISDRMSYLATISNTFEIFQWGKIFNNRGAVCKILTDFQSENYFELTKERRINFLAIGTGSGKSVTTPSPNIGHGSRLHPHLEEI